MGQKLAHQSSSSHHPSKLSHKSIKEYESKLPPEQLNALRFVFDKLKSNQQSSTQTNDNVGGGITKQDFSKYLNIPEDLSIFLFESILQSVPSFSQQQSSQILGYEALLTSIVKLCVAPGSSKDLSREIICLFAKTAKPSTQLHPRSPRSPVAAGPSSSSLSTISPKGSKQSTPISKDSEILMSYDDLIQILYGMFLIAKIKLSNINRHVVAILPSETQSIATHSLAPSTVTDPTHKWNQDIETNYIQPNAQSITSSLKPIHSALYCDSDIDHDDSASCSTGKTGRTNSFTSTTAVFNLKIDPEDAVSVLSRNYGDGGSLKSTNRDGTTAGQKRAMVDVKFTKSIAEQCLRFVKKLKESQLDEIKALFGSDGDSKKGRGEKEDKKVNNNTMISFEEFYNWQIRNMPNIWTISLQSLLFDAFLKVPAGLIHALKCSLGDELEKFSRYNFEDYPERFLPIIPPQSTLLDYDTVLLLSTFLPPVVAASSQNPSADTEQSPSNPPSSFSPIPSSPSSTSLNPLPAHWKLLYQSSMHGYSLSRFELQVFKYPSPSLLLISGIEVTTNEKVVVGAYIPVQWKSTKSGYFGDENTFLFILNPMSKFEVFSSIEKMIKSGVDSHGVEIQSTSKQAGKDYGTNYIHFSSTHGIGFGGSLPSSTKTSSLLRSPSATNTSLSQSQSQSPPPPPFRLHISPNLQSGHFVLSSKPYSVLSSTNPLQPVTPKSTLDTFTSSMTTSPTQTSSSSPNSSSTLPSSSSSPFLLSFQIQEIEVHGFSEESYLRQLKNWEWEKKEVQKRSEGVRLRIGDGGVLEKELLGWAGKEFYSDDSDRGDRGGTSGALDKKE